MTRRAAKPPMTREARRASKQKHILATAHKLLRQHGHERLSLRNVARSAGMSPAGMYEFFEDREHLVATLGSATSARLSRSLRRATRDAPDPVERLVRLGLAYIRFAKRYPADFATAQRLVLESTAASLGRMDREQILTMYAEVPQSPSKTRARRYTR